MERWTKWERGRLYSHGWQTVDDLLNRISNYEDCGLEPEEVISALHELAEYRALGTVEELNQASYDATL